MLRSLAVLMTVLLGIGVAAGTSAAAGAKKRLHASVHPRHARPAVSPLAANGYNGYYEHVLDRVPFGSQLWWRVYDGMPKSR